MAPSEAVPSLPPRYMVSFIPFHERGFGVPASRFMRALLHHYGVELHNLNPNSIAQAAITTGIRLFAECQRLCRVLFIGHSAKPTLPSATLGKVLRSVKILFTECGTLGTAQHSAKTALPRVKHSAKTALDKGPLAAVYS
jgi:hypothetical protein